MTPPPRIQILFLNMFNAAKLCLFLAYSVSGPNKQTRHVTLTCSEWRDRYFIVPPALFENGCIGSGSELVENGFIGSAQH